MAMWAVAHPSTGHEGVSRRAGSVSKGAEPGHDRAGAGADLPAEAGAPSVRPSTVRCGVHPSTGAGRVERRGVDEGHGGGIHRGGEATGSGSRRAVLDRRARAAEGWIVGGCEKVNGCA